MAKLLETQLLLRRLTSLRGSYVRADDGEAADPGRVGLPAGLQAPRRTARDGCKDPVEFRK
eukprot:scaffold13246_cov29-Prasinocladus_malaysianus.AAC.1